MGLQGWSPDLGLGFPGGGGKCRPHPGLKGGCFSRRARHQAGGRQLRAVGVWVKKTMVGWSDNHCLDGCGVEVHLVPSQLAPAHGSSLSGAEVMECTCPP